MNLTVSHLVKKLPTFMVSEFCCCFLNIVPLEPTVMLNIIQAESRYGISVRDVLMLSSNQNLDLSNDLLI